MTHIHTTRCVPRLQEEWNKATERMNAINRALLEAEANPDYNFPDEPPKFDDEATYIAFVKRFSGETGKAYAYAAVRGPGANAWSVTGRSAMSKITWGDLMKFVVRDETCPEDAVASITQMKSKKKNLIEAQLKDNEPIPSSDLGEVEIRFVHEYFGPYRRSGNDPSADL